MAQPTQANRFVKLKIPSLGEDVMVLKSLDGDEALSELFTYQVSAYSDDSNIKLEELLGQKAHVEMLLDEGGTKYFDGHIISASFDGQAHHKATYSLQIRPWFWFLTKAITCRFYQNMTTPDIFKAICGDHGFTDIKEKFARTYKPHEYCVQYQESDFNFLSRLLEEEGIYYYFEHEAGKHTLVLIDAISQHSTVPNYATVPYFPEGGERLRERDHLSQWASHNSVQIANVSLDDYDLEHPTKNQVSKSQKSRPYQQASKLEAFEYRGGYVQDMQTAADHSGDQIASTRLEEQQARYHVTDAAGSAMGIRPGYMMTLEKHYRSSENIRYLTIAAKYRIRSDAYMISQVEEEIGYEMSCSFIPDTETYRPPRRAVKPVISGPQTAEVVGDDEITTDEYGRIEIEFHWASDAPNSQETKTGWVRVAQIWAGNNWGAQFIPRNGQEVVVDFLNGDPNKPLVTGSVYNKDHMPPYALPDNKNKSGIKSDTVHGNGYNELCFDDTKGEEQIIIHAQKDHNTKILNDKNMQVDNDENHTVDKNRNKTVKVDEKMDVLGNQSEEIKGRRTLKVKSSESIDITTSSNKKAGKVTIQSNSTMDLKATGIMTCQASLIKLN